MNYLPSMDVLGFLDWMDRKGYFYKIQQVSFEEMLLEPNHDKQINGLIRKYRDFRKNNYTISDRDFEHRVDILLSYLKREIMNEYLENGDTVYYPIDVFRIIQDTLDNAKCLENSFGPYRRNNDEAMLEELRHRLNYVGSSGNRLVELLENCQGTSANVISEFDEWLEDQIDEVDFSKIPDTVLDRYINQFEDEYYRWHTNISVNEKHSVGQKIKRAIQNRDTTYFIQLTNRYRKRTAKYKCVFLAKDHSFYDLVSNNWKQLHEYTGNYLDVFYQPDELERFSGYCVADKLQIRKLVDDYPCIYLWNTTLSEGKTISVKELDEESLLQLIEKIVDAITENLPLNDVVETGRKFAELLNLELKKEEKVEEVVLENLIHACIQLQNNPDIFGNANENQKNTQIRDLMRNLFVRPIKVGERDFRIEIDDQSLHGFSATGKSAGEVDLLVKLEALPYTIIEGIDIKARNQGKKWDRSKLIEHINRFGQYDQNGLERNILLVYVRTDSLQVFCQYMKKSIEGNSNSLIRDSRIRQVEPVPMKSNNAAIQLFMGKYLYNNIVRKLYICVVQMPYM